MKYNKILARVLMVSVVCCLVITYTGSSSGTPPTEEDLLAQSHGLIVTSNKETAYPDSENAWRYRLHISPEGDSGVLVQKLEIKCYTFRKEYVLDETFDGNDFKDWWGSPYIQAGQTRNFGAGLSSKSNIYYRDHIFIGIDDTGNEVKGTIRVHFSKEEAPPTEQETEGSLPEGVPTEDEFLSQSHGIRVECDKHIVYYEEGGWYYTLRISPISDVGVNLQEVKEVYYTSRGQYVVVRTHGEDWIRSGRRTNSTHIAPGEIWEFTTGFSLAPGDQLTIEFEDYIFSGIDDNGNEVKGTIRVHFSKEEAPTAREETTNPPAEESITPADAERWGLIPAEDAPTEKELLAQCHGIKVISDKKIVYPNEEGMWEYQLKISPGGDIAFTLKTIEMFCSDRGFYGPLSPRQEDIHISPGQVRNFSRSFSPPEGKLTTEYHDNIFLGVDDDGNEVKGTIRIYFEESGEETTLPSQPQDIK